MTDERTDSVVFLYGADMRPEAIRQAQPGARFIARAWVVGASLSPPTPFGDAAADVWGILITIPVQPTGETSAADAWTGIDISATTDDGRTIAANVATPPDALADLAATVAAARYWELPPSYVVALAAALPQPV